MKKTHKRLKPMILGNNRLELKIEIIFLRSFFARLLCFFPFQFISVNNPKGIDRKFMFASQKAFGKENDALIDFLTFWHNNKKCCLYSTVYEVERKEKGAQKNWNMKDNKKKLYLILQQIFSLILFSLFCTNREWHLRISTT